MLLYTTIMSPGYFLAEYELPVVGSFAVLALTIASPIVVLA